MVLVVALVVVALLAGWQNGLGRLDQTLYDQFLTSIEQPRRDDIIIIAIDDLSLQQLGRWPWSRQVHARLLDVLAPSKPRVIGLDVILNEPEVTPTVLTSAPNGIEAGVSDSGVGDRALRTALGNIGSVVLPVVITNPGTGLAAGLPIPQLAEKAAALGHINLEHDSDGVVRSVFLKEGLDGTMWPHFAVALATFKKTGRTPVSIRTGVSPHRPQSDAAFALWQRKLHFGIPFSASGSFSSVPYVSVLRGEVPAEFFRDKYVLIGATALGLTDSYPTPVSGNAGAMPGIEIHANILASLLDGRSIILAAPWQTALLSTVPVLLALLAYLLLSPRVALVTMVALTAATILASYLALRQGIWVAPSAACIVLLLSYPIWSWRRLEAAINYLGQEFLRLDHEPHLLPEVPTSRRQDVTEDILERRISAMKNAARRVRDLRKFVSNSLDNLPDATVVTNVDGQILLANRVAVDYFDNVADTSSGTGLIGHSVLTLLALLHSPQPIETMADRTFIWSDLLDPTAIAAVAEGIGANDQQHHDLLIKSAPCYSTAQILTGWIVSLTDISTIRAAERSRDETLRFLSHDMRAPQTSILALLELQLEPVSALPQEEFFSRIEKATRKTLGLADNFVQLARAEASDYRCDEIDFQDVLFDAIDEMWTLSRNKGIEILTSIGTPEGAGIDELDSSSSTTPADDYPVVVDRALMTRVLTNLLSNALTYSMPGTLVLCTLVRELDVDGPRIVCRIRDEGYGIAPDDQKKLFKRFARVELPSQPRHDGVGLGLVFVKTVVDRHAGRISFVSEPGRGTCFTLILPCSSSKQNHIDDGEQPAIMSDRLQTHENYH